MTVAWETHAVRISDGLPVVTVSIYAVPGEDGTIVNDPRATPVGFLEGEYVLLYTQNTADPPEDYNIITDPFEWVAAVAAYQDALDAAAAAAIAAAEDYEADALSVREAAYDELILLGLTVDSAEYLTRMIYS